MVKSKRINKTFSKDGDFAKYLTHVNDAIIQVNSKGIIEAWLGSASKIFGFTEKSMLGKHISTIISEYERERNEIIKYMLTNRSLSGYETQLMNKGGTDVYCSVTLIPAKKKRSYLLIISDISEQRSFHDKYYSLQKLHNELLDNLATGLMIVDRETHEIVYSNKPAMNLLQLSSKEIIGRKFWDFVLPDMVKTVESVFASQDDFFTSGPIEFKLEKYHDKKPFWAELYISRLNYHRRPCNLITFKDTTNQKEYINNLEKLIKEKDLLTTTKSRFMANMSHELRSPINIILGYVDILAGFEDLQGESKEFLTYIQKSAEHLLKTLNDILDLSKAEASKIKLIEKPYNLVALIKSVLSLIEVKLIGKKIALDYNSTIEPDAYFNIDAHNLQRVFLNILDNAVKFTDEGLISVDVRYKNNTLIFTVSDTGIGMTQEEVDRLFIPFEQAHYEISQRYGGTGLGLSISKEICSLWKGEIKVESKKNAGTTVTFTYPTSRTEAIEEAEVIKVPEDISLIKGKKILVVDDQEYNHKLFKLMMNECEVETVFSGKLALNKLITEDFDGLVLDLRLPDIGGLDVIKEIKKRERLKDLKIVATSADVLSGLKEQIEEQGIVFIPKPVRRADLLNALLTVFSR